MVQMEVLGDILRVIQGLERDKLIQAVFRCRFAGLARIL